ncbi:MAG: diaminopimelate decarboxylase [Candidatus Omnitrophica bacterium]|nr:diaminopimelate decarboxylase [Candidatus Omnitrophota bacterium]
MHEFRYKGSDLYCEGVKLADLVDEVGTPCYVYSYKTFIEHFERLKKAFGSIQPLICYSMKACSNLALVRALVKKGAGLDIVSGGELFRAKKALCRGEKVVFAGVGKSDGEIRKALEVGVLLFNVESESELNAIQRIASSLKKRTSAALRLNPNIGAGGHAYTTTGGYLSKFGIDFETAQTLFLKRYRWPDVHLCGVHVHIGSQILETRPFVEALKRTLKFIEKIRLRGVKIQYLDFGGGLGIIYDRERAQSPADYAQGLVPFFRKSKCKIILEPGRFISGNSGVFLTKVQYVKPTAKKRFIIVDGAMNDLVRPALYGSFHDIFPVRRNGQARKILADVVGPVCESGDFLAKDRRLPEVNEGEYLAVLSAGAYGFSMSSNYNSRPRAAEVLVKGSRFYVIRRRELLNDLVRGERIPAFLR